MSRRSLILAIILLAPCALSEQSPIKPAPSPNLAANIQAVKSSPAYAELLLQRTELQATLDSLLMDYNETYPKVNELRSQIRLIDVEIGRLLVVKGPDVGRLTIALGKLMLRKVELETELETLKLQYKDEHPDVRKTKRQVETFESAIKEILGQ